MESLSAYARQFLEMMQKPDVDQIDGLSPAISIEQKTTSRNPRSTVGTVTEIYDYLRLLFARIGVAYSPATGLPIESQTVTQMVDRLLALPEGTRLYLLAPIVRGRKGEYRKEIADLQKRGFQRLKVNGAFHEIADAPVLDKKFKHDIDVVVDRIVIKPDIATRLADSLETALKLADGIAVAEFADKPLPPSATAEEGANKSKNETHERMIFSQKFACPVSGFTIDEIEPRLFSFNNPFGACPKCDGLGTELRFEPDLVVPDRSLSLRGGAILPWSKTGAASPYYMQTLEALARHFKVSMTAPWEKLPRKVQEAILFGTGEEPVAIVYDDGLRTYKTRKPFEGVIGNIERRWRETDSEWMREELSRYQSDHPCEVCKGYRLKPQALAVRVGGLHIGQVTEMSIRAAGDWFEALTARLKPKDREIANRILKEIRERLKFLVDVGLDYLSMSRNSGTLSGGESQRIRLASQIGSGLTGVLYVLDEPSIGLHQRDNARLLETLRAPARSRQYGAGGRARRRGHPHRRLRRRHRSGRRSARRRDRGGGHPGPGHGQSRLAHRPISRRAATDRGAEKPPQAGSGTDVAGQGRQGQQPQERHRGGAARPVHLRHRRVGRRQVDVAHRYPVSRRRRASSWARASIPPNTTASKGSNISTRSSISTSRPSGARPGPIPPPTPELSRPSATGSRAFPRPRRAATSRAASRST